MLYISTHTKRQMNILPLTIQLVGYNHLQEPISRSRSFPLYQWIYCVDGKGEFTIHGQKSVLFPGQLILIYPYEAHSYRAITEEWHVHIIGFSGNCCMEILKTLKMHESGIYHFKTSEIFERYFEKMISIQKQIKVESGQKKHGNTHNKDMAIIELSRICYDFLLDLSLSVHFRSATLPGSENEKIKILITYMEEHYNEPISLDILGEQVNLSRGHISEMFKKEMQQTVIQYLTNFRISQARIMLTEYPERKVGDIGRLCGFENPSYFGETFKKVVGMTPAEYRMS